MGFELTWVIVKTDTRKEAFVAGQVANLGFDCWVPCQMIATRPHAARKVTAKAMVSIKELPILPKRIFARMDWHEAGALRGIRHLQDVERDGEERIVAIPDSQIAAFKAEIDRENTAALALAQKASRRQKAKWRSLKDALLELVDSAKRQMEIAA
jgi:hypothetical protein